MKGLDMQPDTFWCFPMWLGKTIDRFFVRDESTARDEHKVCFEHGTHKKHSRHAHILHKMCTWRPQTQDVKLSKPSTCDFAKQTLDILPLDRNSVTPFLALLVWVCGKICYLLLLPSPSCDEWLTVRTSLKATSSPTMKLLCLTVQDMFILLISFIQSPDMGI